MARRARTQTGTLAMLFFAPPSGLDSEMDFTTFEYLLKDPANPNNFTVVSRETIASLILNPTSPNQNLLNNLLMRRVGGQGVICPAHLPNYYDIYPLKSEFHIFLRWCLGQSFNPSSLVPAMHVLDPKPVIHLNEQVVTLEHTGLRLCVGTYTDAFQLIKLPIFPHVLHVWVGFETETSIVPGYHKVDFTPFQGVTAVNAVKGPPIPMPKDTYVCCWNVRGLAGPSLVAHFNQLYERYKPGVIVMLESRQSMENVQLLVTSLPGKYCVLFYPPNGLSGGVVTLWNNEIIAIDQRIIQSDFVRADIYFKGHPNVKRPLF